ncbi:MAG TPA: undecaprenyl/decaprenyl-phosphate alpha-N-acetylglucosaminyl 1-phosphate transferase [Candidatus Omnitrophica bacterium]|nr:undecaprenyl/decaprenyl-phosphate alpha-N-acetylglucosaminyl 1-phosphate transferase [Candidatus Omnitrophota bacterium]
MNNNVFVLNIILSFILTLILIPPLRKLAKKSGFVSRRPSYKSKRVGIPYLGGGGLYLSFAIVLLINVLFRESLGVQKSINSILLGGTLIFILGLYDDWKELPPGVKFIGQAIAISLAIALGIRTTIGYIPQIFNVMVTFIWIISITNALNLLDILDGLASGIALICSAALLLLGIITSNTMVVLLSSVVVGSTLAFLVFNFPPAKIFMGDSGSMFLGFFLSTTAILISFAPESHEIALLSPLLILGIPISDTLYLIYSRLKKKKPVFKKSNDHFVFHLLDKGLSEKKTLLSMYLLAIFLSASAIALTRLSNLAGILLVGLITIILILIGRRATASERK